MVVIGLLVNSPLKGGRIEKLIGLLMERKKKLESIEFVVWILYLEISIILYYFLLYYLAHEYVISRRDPSQSEGSWIT